MTCKHVEFTPEGVCSQKIEFDLVNGYVHHVKFTGGCAGNTKGVALLAEGQNAMDLVRRLKNINCHDGNSCPRQFALAVEQSLREDSQD